MVFFSLVSTGAFRNDRFGGGDADPLGRRLSTFGMILFLISLAVLFAAGVVLHLVSRRTTPGAAHVPPPALLWLSAPVLLVSSATMHAALQAVRRGASIRFRRRLAVTAALGGLFLLLQAAGWIALMLDRVFAASSLAAFSFYLLTGLHAAHVLGGLISLGIVLRRAAAGCYGPAEHTGVWLATLYWHFLGGVWLVLFGVLFLA